ncbi:MAG: hypothetical protein PHU34_08030 [Candidatus Methanoperedens sp.]|nr:hypothetical protein [Candidatus Methanoperedens sp.]
MTEKRQPNLSDLFTAEFWAEFLAEAFSETFKTPIQNFKFNILKAKALHATAKEISHIFQKMIEKMPESETEIVFVLYYVYTEQALVSAVSASEVYFKDILAYTIQNDNRLLNRYLDKEIKVKRILDAGLNLSDNIGILIVESMNFQSLDNVRDEYKRVLSFEPFTKEELKKLKEIFAIRHLIVHKSGIVDHMFISTTGLNYPVGKRLVFRRDEILQMIEFIDNIVNKIDSQLNPKPALEGEIFDSPQN